MRFDAGGSGLVHRLKPTDFTFLSRHNPLWCAAILLLLIRRWAAPKRLGVAAVAAKK